MHGIVCAAAMDADFFKVKNNTLYFYFVFSLYNISNRFQCVISQMKEIKFVICFIPFELWSNLNELNVKLLFCAHCNGLTKMWSNSLLCRQDWNQQKMPILPGSSQLTLRSGTLKLFPKFEIFIMSAIIQNCCWTASKKIHFCIKSTWSQIHIHCFILF